MSESLKIKLIRWAWKHPQLRGLVKAAFFGPEWRKQFYLEMSHGIKISGGNINTACEIGLTLAKQNNLPDVIVYERLHNILNRGDDASFALKPFLPPVEVLLIMAGEQSPNPEESFILASGYIDKMAETRKPVKNLLSTTLGMAGLLAVLFLAVLPIMISNIETVTEYLPEIMEADSGIGDYLNVYSMLKIYVPIAAVIFTVAIFAAIISLPRWRAWFPGVVGKYRPLEKFLGKQRVIADQKSIIHRIYRRGQSVGLLYSMASLIESGIPLVQSINNMIPLSSKYLKDFLRTMSKRAESGEDLKRVFAVPLYDRAVQVSLSKLANDGGSEGLMNIAKRESDLSALSASRAQNVIYLFGLLLVAAGILFAAAGYYYLFQAVSEFQMKN